MQLERRRAGPNSGSKAQPERRRTGTNQRQKRAADEGTHSSGGDFSYGHVDYQPNPLAAAPAAAGGMGLLMMEQLQHLNLMQQQLAQQLTMEQQHQPGDHAGAAVGGDSWCAATAAMQAAVTPHQLAAGSGNPTDTFAGQPAAAGAAAAPGLYGAASGGQLPLNALLLQS
ncbi:hypothetical protein COO60DRAFT_1626600, partial [Scenedesmus sp. NREL 46B-D3]